MIKPKKKKTSTEGAAGLFASTEVVSARKASKHSPDRPEHEHALNPKKKAKTNLSTQRQCTTGKEQPIAAHISSTSASFGTCKISILGGSVDCQGLDKALRALCRHVQKLHEREKLPDLLAGSEGPTVCLMFSLQNIPDRQRITPHIIELPHSPLSSESEVCLIVRDPQRKWKDLVANSPSLSQVTKVISYKKLPKKFPQFSDRRALCAAFEAFLVDTRVKEKAYNSLGKVFFNANKLPLPIRVGATTLDREVCKALHSTSLVIRRGPSVAVRIGKAFAPPEHLYANAVATIKEVSSFFQTNIKWKNTLTTIHVQATNTPALPVYMHPKYAEAAEHYRLNKPPSSDSDGCEIKQKAKEEKKQTAQQDATKAPNKVKETRKVKRGITEDAKKWLDKSLKNSKSSNLKKQK